MKIFLTIMIIVIILLGGGMLLRVPSLGDSGGFLASLGGEARGEEVRADPVETRELIESISAPGEIEPHTKVEISSQIVSEITALPFREGDVVSRGDIVVRLDDRDLKARLASAKASLASAKANLEATRASRNRAKSVLDEQLERRKGLLDTLEFAQRNLERKQELYDSGDISMAEYDQALERVRDIQNQIAAMDATISAAENSLEQADADILRAQAAVKQAEAEIELAEEGLRNTTIASPINGKVVKLNAEVGETVITGTMNNPGTVIMTIADLSRMRMIARVDQSDIAPMREGQSAKVHINAYEETAFAGTVERIALQMTRQPDGTGFYETEIALRLDGREIKSGGDANVDIQVNRHYGLVVPSQAIVDRDIEELPDEVLDGSTAVDRTKRIVRIAYRVVDGKAVATPVKVGPSDLTHTLVLAGLSEGDLVITGPYKVLDTIRHNDPVHVKPTQASASAEETASDDQSPETTAGADEGDGA